MVATIISIVALLVAFAAYGSANPSKSKSGDMTTAERRAMAYERAAEELLERAGDKSRVYSTQYAREAEQLYEMADKVREEEMSKMLNGTIWIKPEGK